MAVLDAAAGGLTARASIWEGIRARHEGRRLSRLIAVALLLVTQGLVHIGQAPGHFAEYTPFGVLFLLTGAGQVAAGIATLGRPKVWMVLLSAAGTVGVIATWFWSRRAGPTCSRSACKKPPGRRRNSASSTKASLAIVC